MQLQHGEVAALRHGFELSCRLANLLQAGQVLVTAQITALKHKLSVTGSEHVAATHLEVNEIGFCNLAAWQITAGPPQMLGTERAQFSIEGKL